MEKRRCLYCNAPLPETKRADSKFCNNSCKAWYWEKNKGKGVAENLQPNEENKQAQKIQPETQKGIPLAGLRGVIYGDPEEESKAKPNEELKQNKKGPSLTTTQNLAGPVSDCPPADTQEETEAYKKALLQKEECERIVNKIKNVIRMSNEQIKQLEELHPQERKKTDRFYRGIDAQLASDMVWEDEPDKEEKEFEKGKTERLAKLMEGKALAERMLPEQSEKLKKATEALDKIPRYKRDHKPFKERWEKLFAKDKKGVVTEQTLGNYTNEQNETKQSETDSQENINTNEEMNANESKTNENTDNVEDILKNYPWIIKSEDVLKVKRSKLNFQGKWKDFLGQPGTDFHMAVHGPSGQGKSTLCFKFAKYLAVNFGMVIYFANEESTETVTFEQKVKLAGAEHPNLRYINISAHENIMERVPAGIFHFIFIDSLNTMKISPEKLRELKAHFKGSAFITISRETKQSGQLRGSGEIIYDSDIVVEVNKGIATTNKNRYKEAEQELVVIENKKEGKKDERNKGISGLRNVI